MLGFYLKYQSKTGYIECFNNLGSAFWLFGEYFLNNYEKSTAEILNFFSAFAVYLLFNFVYFAENGSHFFADFKVSVQ